jgi:hypothetical protein
MGFFTPWFLAGAAAVGLPIWLHLLKKHRSTPLPFSSLMFFERHTQSSIMHRRLRYLVLLTMRTALVLLLALAFAGPYFNRTILGGQRAGEITMFAVDNSLSMRAGDRLARAKQLAKSDIASLGPGKRGQALAFGSRVQVMSEVTDDHAPLLAAIDAIEPSDARTSFAELARAARSMARSLRLPVKVQLYSDMQQTGLPPNFNDLRLNEDIRLEPHAVADSDTPNFAVENVVAPRRVYDNRKTRVLATIAGFATKKATRTATLRLNDRVIESKTVEVPENGRANAEFLSLDVPYGHNKGEVRIDGADALPDDDRFYFAIERGDPRHALFVHEAGNERGLLYFRSALEASGQSAFLIDSASADQTGAISASKYAFVVLSDPGALPGGFENELRNYVRNGGSVWIALGHNSVGRPSVPVSGDRIEETRYNGREGERFQTAAWLDSAHPSIQNDNRWDDVKFYQAIRVTPGDARVAARLSDGTPLLLDRQVGTGRVLVFASTFDNVANDFPLHTAFVPFVEQTARYLGRLEGGPASLAVGAYVELRDAKAAGAAAEVIGPKGERLLSLEEGTRAENIQLNQAGFYEIHRPNGPDETVAANTDRRESDLAPAPAETLALWRNTAQGSGGALETTEGGKKPFSLWWYVMIAALALAVAESLLGNRHLSVDKEAA